MALKDSMTLTETSVVKRGTPEVVAREAARTRRAREIGLRSGLFLVPRVVGCEAAEGILELERLDCLEPMQRLVAYASATMPVWSRLGAVLAAIHGDRELGGACEPLPSPWRQEGAAEVSIHGDFDCGNIHYQRKDDMIVVLDWAVSPMFGVFGEVGPRCFDVSFFMSGAFFLARRYVWRRAIREKLNRFLRAYEAASPERLDRVALVDFALRAGRLRVERQPRSALQRAAYRRSFGRLQRFLEHDLAAG